MRLLSLLSGVFLAISAAWAAPSYSVYTGQYGAAVTARGFDYSDAANGLLVVSGIPDGATVVQALLVTNSWFSANPVTGSFTASGLPSISPTSGAGSASGYRWDVTSSVTGNGSYAFSFADTSYAFGAALVVIYSAPGLPSRTVAVADFTKENGASGTLPMSYTANLPYNGSGYLWTYTQADDTLTTGEQILFNGSVVGGPLDANLGNFASLVRSNVSAYAGLNDITITSRGDYFAWQLAVLQLDNSSNPQIPEPSTALLALLGLSALALRRRKK